MDDLALIAGLTGRLASHIASHRRKIVASVLHANGTSRPGSIAASLFVNSLLDRIVLECETRDCASLDSWVVEFGSVDPLLDYSGLILVTFAALGASYTVIEGPSPEIVRHLALRGNRLERVVTQTRSERLQAKIPDPTQVVAKEDLKASWLAALEAYDSVAAEHSRAVGVWCRRIAEAMGMNPEGVQFVEMCGTLHDIGKIAIPLQILNKPGPLTNNEWEIMRSHSERSAHILERIPSLYDLAPIARAHHERFDGMGYPDRLVGNAIPLAARIVAVADSFNAMISKRPYREAMSVTQAINALMDGRGRQWDPAVVDVMLTVVKPHMIAQIKRASEAM